MLNVAEGKHLRYGKVNILIRQYLDDVGEFLEAKDALSCSELMGKCELLASDLRNGRVIGSTEAAYAVLNILSSASSACRDSFAKFVATCVPRLIKARPTSIVMVNLTRELLKAFVELARSEGFSRAVEEVPRMVSTIKEKIELVKKSIATHGSKRIVDGDVILTHSYSSTVIELFREALKRGIKFSVIVTESRPIGEGKLTASIVSKMGLETTLIVDSAVRFIMKRVSKVFVGADAVAANGAVVNKVGTSAIALAAKEARVRTYVAAGTYKMGLETVFGELIKGIVLSDAELIIPKDRIPELAGKVLVRAPLFDVTPPEYIDAIITESGVMAPQATPLLIKEVFGWPPRVPEIGELVEEVVKLAGS